LGVKLRYSNFIKIFVSIFTIILLLTPNILAKENKILDTNNVSNEISILDCYGIIIPSQAINYTTYETFLNDKIKNLINDLLRENISVYWASSNFSILSAEFNSSIIIEKSFNKGDFIVPFTGDNYLDTLGLAMIIDYNITNEIYPDNTLKIEVYKILEKFEVQAYKLKEVKIAQHFGNNIRYTWPCYLQIAEAGGFFDIELLLDSEASIYLNNQDFNVFMWPYNPTKGTAIGVLKSVINPKECNAIRKFVRNGGGYIGSCYGATIGSSGMLNPFPFFSLRHFYNENLSFRLPIAFYSLSDSLLGTTFLMKKPLFVATLDLDTNHPINYGVNKTFKDFFNGCWFVWLGKNSNGISTFKNLESEKHYFGNQRYKRNVIGTPAWINSTFGNGKVVLFQDHPEFVDNLPVIQEKYTWEGDLYHGRRVIQNSLFFTASKEMIMSSNFNHPNSFIENIKEKTINVSLKIQKETDSTYIRNEINKMLYDLVDLKSNGTNLLNIYYKLLNKTLFFQRSSISIFTYFIHFCDIYSDYLKRIISNLDKIDNISDIIEIKSEIFWRLNESKNLLSDIKIIVKDLQDLMLKKNNVLNYLKINKDSCYMIRTFEIGLKYLPQTYHETEKYLRSSWYNIEAEIAS